MEELLFYNYLNYQKTQSAPLGKRIFQFPRIPLFFCFLSLLAMLVGIIAMICNAQVVAIIAVIIEVSSGFALEYTLEDFKIKNSKDRITKFYTYSLNLKDWLISNLVEDVKDICEIKSRIEKRIATYKKEQDALSERIDKWLQILAVPITILAITYIINQTIPLVEKMSYVISILLVFGILYGFISIMKNISRFIGKRKAEQMEYFAEDLQAILDLDTFNLSGKISDNMQAL